MLWKVREIISLAAALTALAAPRAEALTVTFDNVTRTAPPGVNFVPIAGEYGAPRAGFLDGLRVVPATQGVTPIAFVIDTPRLKFLGVSDFAMRGPRSANPLVYAPNRHSFSIEHEFGPLLGFNVGRGFLNMSTRYVAANRFNPGGELRVGGAIGGNRINGTGVNFNLDRPILIPGVDELIYHPADDIRVRFNVAQHSCDTTLDRPPRSTCSVSELLSVGPDGFRIQADGTVTFTNPDAFVFPGSIEVSAVPLPAPAALMGTLVAFIAVAARRRRRKQPAQRCCAGA